MGFPEFLEHAESDLQVGPFSGILLSDAAKVEKIICKGRIVCQPVLLCLLPCLFGKIGDPLQCRFFFACITTLITCIFFNNFFQLIGVKLDYIV